MEMHQHQEKQLSLIVLVGSRTQYVGVYTASLETEFPHASFKWNLPQHVINDTNSLTITEINTLKVVAMFSSD